MGSSCAGHWPGWEGGPGLRRPDAALGSLCLAVGLGARPSAPTVELTNALISVKNLHIVPFTESQEEQSKGRAARSATAQ